MRALPNPSASSVVMSESNQMAGGGARKIPCDPLKLSSKSSNSVLPRPSDYPGELLDVDVLTDLSLLGLIVGV
jgi:hypothetical protein